MVQEPDNLNPFIGVQGIDYMFWHMNYDFLVGFDSKTLEPRPELATEWTVSEDGKEWTFTIREGSTWQDGEPVTAARRGVHLQLHRRQRTAQPVHLHQRHHRAPK